MKNIAIIGSGTWGVALSIHLANNGHHVKIWSFTQEETDAINNDRKCKFLPDATIPDGVECFTNMEEVINGSDLILHVTPSKFVRSTIKKYEQYVTNQPIIMCAKGFEETTLITLSQVIEEELPNSEYGIFSGPSHAEEVSLGIPTAIVIASKSKEVQELVQDTFMNEKMRVYTSDDVIGVELGGALKNIIAFCAGIITGQQLGDNTFAALLTRGLSEMAKLSIKMGGEPKTIYGLTGLGDLIVTCMSNHSRNRRAGILIGQGKTIEEAKQEIGMTIESIDNIRTAYKLSQKYDVEMPIVNAVYKVLFEKLEAQKAISDLMTRNPKFED